MTKRKTGRKKISKFDQALIRLRKLKRDQQSKAMSFANKSFINQFCNKVKKLRHKKISPKDAKVLRRNSLKLKKLVSKKTSFSKKRKMLSQRGGFLPALLPLLAPVIGTIASSIFGRR